MTAGIDTPDRRGRTGLDRAGQDLTGNPRVRITDVRLLSSHWYVERATTFDFRRADGTWSTQERETHDRGNGATVLLYDTARETVLLTRQFRLPVYVNGHPDGMLIETPGGVLDDEDEHPEVAVRREVVEETGHTVGEVRHVFDVYMSPGSVTERVSFYAAAYGPATRTHEGGGLDEEGEDIETLELPFRRALAMIRTGEIVDAKTIMLLQWAALEGPFALPGRGTEDGDGAEGGDGAEDDGTAPAGRP
ncbi:MULTISPECIES: NUDIX domain-containing protein [Streptomyces]|uniref:NUDIX domain-containing protein n=1 Tax=Streptomyces rochei TaxID=1928 RepID=A0ABW7DUR0_STRRO|nr:NUDIX domain-containing protein [Streptomyces sp. MBT28]